MVEIRQYRNIEHLRNEWDRLVAESKNGTFMLYRQYIEYHSDRFDDLSLLIYYENKLVALLPLSREGEWVYSHKGLTYGGLIIEKNQKLEIVFKCLNAVIKYLDGEGVKQFLYKRVPSHYHIIPADEDEYFMFRVGAKLIRRDSALVIDRRKQLALQKRRERAIKKALKAMHEIRVDDKLGIFWKEILIPNLVEKYGTKPVHDLDEITLLKSRFSKNINQVNIYDKRGKILAGTTLFLTDNCVHAQYISGSSEGRSSGALDLLFYKIISEMFLEKPYFDFGISNEHDGRLINRGLLEWKEGFGGRCVSHDFYLLETSKTLDLTEVFI